MQDGQADKVFNKSRSWIHGLAGDATVTHAHLISTRLGAKFEIQTFKTSQGRRESDNSPPSTTMSNAADIAALDEERASRHARLKTVMQEEEDPLAFYDEFVKWTIESYPPTHIPRAGLLELLDEAIRQFKNDKTYKVDRRYLKLWLTYAQYVEDDHDGAAVEVCKFVIEHDIGTAYAQLYEHYASALERRGRCVLSNHHRTRETCTSHYPDGKTRIKSINTVSSYARDQSNA